MFYTLTFLIELIKLVHSSAVTNKLTYNPTNSRHRMAQEIQRKLEEIDVKAKDLEQRGVAIEKALRGECGSKESERDESDLLKEWFDLMRDLSELRRYERELLVRGQELELEDRHARLQNELRERLENGTKFCLICCFVLLILYIFQTIKKLLKMLK